MKYTFDSLHNTGPSKWTSSPKTHVVYGGGGGGTQTSTSGLPDWARPAVESSLNKAVATEAAGGFSHVENLTPEQQASLQRQLELGQRGGVYDQLAADSYGAAQTYRDAAAGTGLFGADALGRQAEALQPQIESAVQQSLGQSAYSASRQGTLGSARQQALAQNVAQNVGGQLAAQELASRRNAAFQGTQGVVGSGSTIGQQFGLGAATTGAVGDTLQQQGQREGDAAYQGVQRLFGLYGSPALGQKTVTTGGGGK